MIFRWMLLLLAMALPPTTLAGSYRVIFGGAITRIGDGSPDSFSIGERVSGTYEFNTEPEWIFSENVSKTFEREVLGTGPLLLMTESGFVATDTASEILSAWASPLPPGEQIIDDIYSAAALIGNRGRLLNHLLPSYAAVPSALHTLHGPTAIGIELHLKEFDLSPALIAGDIDENGQLNRPLHSFIDPNSITSLTRGIISFDSATPSSRTLPKPTYVHFEIDTLRIVAIPEPATLTLLLLAILATFRPTPLRRAGS